VTGAVGPPFGDRDRYQWLEAVAGLPAEDKLSGPGPAASSWRGSIGIQIGQSVDTGWTLAPRIPRRWLPRA
jgi:hypothetical protein